jgi:hypothetical protein
MSAYTLELVLYDLHAHPEKVNQFHTDVEEYLNDYHLNPRERALIETFDVRTMADMGVSQMLLFCSWQAVQGGPASVPEYMRRMNTPAELQIDVT